MTSNQNPKTKNQIAIVDIMTMEQENFISRRELEKRQTEKKKKKKSTQRRPRHNNCVPLDVGMNALSKVLTKQPSHRKISHLIWVFKTLKPKPAIEEEDAN
jgi:hypothetical protein